MKRVLFAACAALTLLVAACSSGGSPAPKPSDLLGRPQLGNFQGIGLDPAQPRPSFTLQDTSGKPFAFGTDTAGKLTFLFFGYTHCPDECPATMADIRLALKEVPASIASKVIVAFVTTDVRRDTGPVIARWLSQFAKGSKATWIGLRGTQAQIDAAQAAAHVTIAQDGGETHSLEVLLYGSDDYAHVSFLENTHEAEQMAHDLKIVAGEGT